MWNITWLVPDYPIQYCHFTDMISSPIKLEPEVYHWYTLGQVYHTVLNKHYRHLDPPSKKKFPKTWPINFAILKYDFYLFQVSIASFRFVNTINRRNHIMYRIWNGSCMNTNQELKKSISFMCLDLGQPERSTYISSAAFTSR